MYNIYRRGAAAPGARPRPARPRAYRYTLRSLIAWSDPSDSLSRIAWRGVATAGSSLSHPEPDPS